MATESHGIIQAAKDFASGLPEGTNIFVVVFTWISGFLYLRAKRSKTKLGETADDAQAEQIKALTTERNTAVADSRESWQKLLLGSERLGVLQAESKAYLDRAEAAEKTIAEMKDSLARARRDRAAAEGRLKDALHLAKQLLPPEGYDLVVLKIYEVSDSLIAKEIIHDDAINELPAPAVKRSIRQVFSDSFLGHNIDGDGTEENSG